MNTREFSLTLLPKAGYWFAVAVWFDIADRLISGPLDQLFSHYHATLWLVGVTACAQ